MQLQDRDKLLPLIKEANFRSGGTPVKMNGKTGLKIFQENAESNFLIAVYYTPLLSIS